MNKYLYKLQSYWKMILTILLTHKKKIFILCHPIHDNLGDQAQLMCTDKWLTENYPDYKIIHLGIFKKTINLHNSPWDLIQELSFRITLCILKIKVRKCDLFIGHSGYFMIDHHNGWKMFVDIMTYFPNNRIVIFPQTINFYTPVIKEFIMRKFALHKYVTLLCRDEISYKQAQKLFPTTHLLLYPDIVTSLIGMQKHNKERDGVLFCMRNDIESFYPPEEIDKLIARFGNIRYEKIDTTIHISEQEMNEKRDILINHTIERIATYKVVITDRYHGTIFSVIASTPVIVISSADHKLSSGVKWFPQNKFTGYVYYAQDIEEAYQMAEQILKKADYTYETSTYFKDNYWNKLKQLIS